MIIDLNEDELAILLHALKCRDVNLRTTRAGRESAKGLAKTAANRALETKLSAALRFSEGLVPLTPEELEKLILGVS